MHGFTICLVIPTLAKATLEPRTRGLVGAYTGRTACRNPASFAVALYCGIGASSLNALVKAFDRLHIVLGWNSSCAG